jgi:tetratricopeptide (TPR) repeat protein
VLYSTVDPTQPHPAFDPQKHSALNVELKLLYVLLTRARQNLVIVDEDKKSREPMLHHWVKQGLIDRRPFTEDIKSLFLATSSPEEWYQRGRQFLERDDFIDARMCFQRAGDEYNEKLCLAHETKKEAGRATGPKSTQLYLQAVILYLELNNLPKVCECCEKAGEMVRAAGYYLEQTPPGVEDAARCYESAKKWLEAARLHEQLRDIDGVLRCCLLIPDYHFAIAALDKLKGEAPTPDWVEIEQDTVWNGALYYHGIKQHDDMMTFVLRFNTGLKKRRFLERYKHFDKLLSMEIHEGNFLVAASHYENLLHDFSKAATYYEKGGNLDDAARCLLRLTRSICSNEAYIVQTVASLPPTLKTTTSSSTSAAVDSDCDPLELLAKAQELAVLALAATPDTPRAQLIVLEATLLMQCGAERRPMRDVMRSIYDQAKGIQAANPQSGAWKIQLMVLRFLVCNHIRAKEGGGGGIIAGDSAVMDVNAFKSVCFDLAAMLDQLLPAMRRVQEQGAMLLSSQTTTLLQCLEYFEMSLHGLGSTAVATSMLQQVSANTVVYSLSQVKGLPSVFKSLGKDFPVTSRRQEPRLGVHSIAILSIREFAQSASRFLEQELVNSLEHCSALIYENVLKIPEDSMAKKAARKIDKSIFTYQSVLEWNLLLNLRDCEKLRVERDTSATEKVGVKKGVGVDLSKFIQTRLLKAVFPPSVELVNVAALVVLRTQTGIRRSKEVVVSFLADRFRQPKLRYDMIAQALLIAELFEHNETIDYICKVVHTEIAKRVALKDTQDVRERLAWAFQWERATDRLPPASFKIHHKFLYSLFTGAAAVLDDLQKGALHLATKGSSASSLAINENLINGCLSPSSLMKLLEKYVVMLLLHKCDFRNVIIHESLASDVLCRNNSVIASAVKNFRGYSQIELNSQPSKDGKKRCLELLDNLVTGLADLIKRLDEKSFDEWCVNSQAFEDMRFSKEKEKYKETREIFVSHAVMLIVVVGANLPPNEKLRVKICVRLAEMKRDADVEAPRSDADVEAPRSDADVEAPRSILKSLHHLTTFLKRINAKDILNEFAAYCKLHENSRLLLLMCSAEVELAKYAIPLVSSSKLSVKVIDVVVPSIVRLVDKTNVSRKLSPSEGIDIKEDATTTIKTLNPEAAAFVPKEVVIRTEAPEASLKDLQVVLDQSEPFVVGDPSVEPVGVDTVGDEVAGLQHGGDVLHSRADVPPDMQLLQCDQHGSTDLFFCHYRLRALAKKARMRLNLLSPLEKYQRFAEKEFAALVKRRRQDPVVVAYNVQLSPLYLQLSDWYDRLTSYISQQEQQQPQKEQQEKEQQRQQKQQRKKQIENIDTAKDALDNVSSAIMQLKSPMTNSSTMLSSIDKLQMITEAVLKSLSGDRNLTASLAEHVTTVAYINSKAIDVTSKQMTAETTKTVTAASVAKVATTTGGGGKNKMKVNDVHILTMITIIIITINTSPSQKFLGEKKWKGK